MAGQKSFEYMSDMLFDMRVVVKLEMLKARRDIVLNIVTDLARNTPVDTSQALSNWEVKKSANFKFGSAHVRGSKGSTREASVALTAAAADRDLSGIPIRDALYIGNAAPYIRKLDRGWSRQRPGPWIERTARRSLTKNLKKYQDGVRAALEVL